MRRLFSVFSGALAISLLALALLLPLPARGQGGEPDLAGVWTGKAKGKRFPLDPRGEGGSEGGGFTMTVTQVGADVDIVVDSGGEDPPVDLSGKTGNGHFWAVGGDPDRPLVVVGHVKKKGTRLKGTVIEVAPDSSSELKIKARRR